MARAWSSSAVLQLSVFALAVCARLAYLFLFRPAIESAYWSISAHLARTGELAIDGAPVSDYEPLYLLFLAAARTLTGDRVIAVQILQVVIASLGAVCLYRLSLTLTSSKRTATVAGVLFALHPLLVRQASAAADLWLATTLLAAFASAFVSMRGTADAAVAGLWIGLAVVTRSMTLPILAGSVILLLATRKAAPAVALAAMAMLLVAPFIARNYQVGGSWWPTRSGMALYVGNSPYSAALLPSEDLDLLQVPAAALIAREQPNLTPDAPEYAATLDAFLTRRSVDYMMERPLATLGQKLLNVAYLFSPTLVPSRLATPETTVTIGPQGEVSVERSVPRPRAETIAYGVAATVVLVTAAVGVYLRRRRLGEDAVLWIVAGVFVVVNAVYVPATRYMAPMLFVMLFYSAVSLSQKRYR